jgi:hypothetical protein
VWHISSYSESPPLIPKEASRGVCYVIDSIGFAVAAPACRLLMLFPKPILSAHGLIPFPGPSWSRPLSKAAPGASPNAPLGGAPLSHHASCWPWHCSNTQWALRMKPSASGCAPTWPSCRRVASTKCTSLVRRSTVACPKPWRSFAVVWRTPSWMSCWRSRPPPRWTRAWSAPRLSSSIPCPLPRAANASRRRPPCTRRKKRPPPRLVLPHPNDDAEEPSPSAPARPAKSHAPLGAPMPRAGQNLREAGAPNRTAAVRTGQRHCARHRRRSRSSAHHRAG